MHTYSPTLEIMYKVYTRQEHTFPSHSLKSGTNLTKLAYE
jgi:hypothetical protein